MRSIDTLNPGLNIIIISAERSNRDARENRANTEDLHQRLASMRAIGSVTAYARATGVWQGEEEASYVVAYDPKKWLGVVDELVRIARNYGQECILLADAERNAELVPVCNPDCTGPLGKLRALRPGEAMPDGYTVLNGVKYICA